MRLARAACCFLVEVAVFIWNCSNVESRIAFHYTCRFHSVVDEEWIFRTSRDDGKVVERRSE